MARETETHDGTEVGEMENASAQPRRLLPMLLVVIGLVAGGGVGWAVVGPVLAERRGVVGAEREAERGSEQRERSFYSIENLVVNPAGTRGMRYLVVTVTVEVKSANAARDLTSRDAEVRDALVRLLGRKTVEELADVDRRESLRQEIHDVIAGMVSRGEVVRVFLPLYVIQ